MTNPTTAQAAIEESRQTGWWVMLTAATKEEAEVIANELTEVCTWDREDPAGEGLYGEWWTSNGVYGEYGTGAWEVYIRRGY
jgi:hypothetical protein